LYRPGIFYYGSSIFSAFTGNLLAWRQVKMLPAQWRVEDPGKYYNMSSLLTMTFHCQIPLSHLLTWIFQKSFKKKNCTFQQ
jgi:hypothetical protein